MTTLGIAILLAAGLAAAKICQKLHLPSVTGYILAGLLLGPTGIGLITEKSIGNSLDHFTQIALMLIAFGVGEHIELRNLRQHAKSLFYIVIAQSIGPLVLVALAVYFTIIVTSFTVEGWQHRDYIALSVLLGAVSIATAPAATLLVIKELKAKGPITSTLMAVVAIDDGLAVMIFGIAVSMTHTFIGQAGTPFFLSITNSFFEIGLSILLGLACGYALSLVSGKMKDSAESMTVGLSILLLCSELAIFLHLSSLLAGMTAGFTLVNKAERDVRIFRALNHFEPPIYILFFTLAGTHLDIYVLSSAGSIGLVYFTARIIGKVAGVHIGGWISNAIPTVQKYLGYALLPQAGVAIGLIFVISSDDALAQYSAVVTPVVLAGVFLSELLGPIGARYAITRANEANININQTDTAQSDKSDKDNSMTVELIPWTWQLLKPKKHPQDVVVFGAANQQTVAGLARTATILAHYFGAIPMAIRVDRCEKLAEEAFHIEKQEVESMGYSLLTEHIPDHHPASGLVAAVEYNNAKAVVLGYPPVNNGNGNQFQNILDTVARHVSCPVVVVRFYGIMHTERILVPITDIDNLAEVFQIVCALNAIGEHRVELLYMISSTAEPNDVIQKEGEVKEWIANHNKDLEIAIRAVPTVSRVETIIEYSRNVDLVVMGTGSRNTMHRFFFGSLATTVAKKLKKPMILVYNTTKIPPSNHQIW